MIGGRHASLQAGFMESPARAGLFVLPADKCTLGDKCKRKYPCFLLGPFSQNSSNKCKFAGARCDQGRSAIDGCKPQDVAAKSEGFINEDVNQVGGACTRCCNRERHSDTAGFGGPRQKLQQSIRR